MADVILRIINEGVTEAIQGVASVGKAYDDLSKKSKEATAEQGKGFKASADAAEKTKTAFDKMAPAVAKPISEIQKLKKEIKDFQNAALKAGEGTKEFAKAIAEAGKRKADLNDLQQAVALLDPDVKAKAFLNLSQTIISGFAAGQGALAAFGVTSEDSTKTLVKLQSAMAFGQFLSSLGELGDTFKVLQVQIRNSEIAQKAFNLVSQANPYVLLATTLGAVGAAFLYSASATEEDTKAFVDNAEALKVANALRDDLIQKLAEISISLQEEAGLISAATATELRLRLKGNLEVSKIEKAKADELAKLRGFENAQEKKSHDDALKNAVKSKKDKAKLLDGLASQELENQAKQGEESIKQLESLNEKENQVAKQFDDAIKKQEELTQKEIKLANDKIANEEAKKQKAYEQKLADDLRDLIQKNASEDANILLDITKKSNNDQLTEFEAKIFRQNLILQRDQDARNQFLETFGKTEIEIKIKQLEDEQKLLLENVAFTEQERFAIIKDTETKISALKQAQLNSQLQGLSQQFQNIAQLEAAFGAQTKAGASAQALVATYLSAQNSFAFGASLGGPILGGIFAAIATAAGLANVAKINGVEFAEGGYTGDGGKYDEAGIVHKGEFVMTKEKTAKHRSLFEAIHNDQQLGFADLASLLKGTGVTLNPDVPAKILKSYDLHDQKQITIRSESDKRLANIEKELKAWRSESTNKEQIIETPNGTVFKKGNVIRIIRRKK